MPKHNPTTSSAPSNVHNRQSGKHLLKMQTPTKEYTVRLTRRGSTILDKSAFQACHVMHCASWCTPPAAMPTQWIHSAMSLPPHMKKIYKFFWENSTFQTLKCRFSFHHPVYFHKTYIQFPEYEARLQNITLVGKTYFPISYEYICGRSMRHVTGSIWYNNT